MQYITGGKKARKDIPLDEPIDNEEFVNTFKRTFISKIKRNK